MGLNIDKGGVGVETSGRLGSSSELKTFPSDITYRRLSESGVLPGKVL